MYLRNYNIYNCLCKFWNHFDHSQDYSNDFCEELNENALQNDDLGYDLRLMINVKIYNCKL